MTAASSNEVEDFGRSNFDDDEDNTALPSWRALKKHNPTEYNRQLEEGIQGILTDIQPTSDRTNETEWAALFLSQRLNDHEGPLDKLIKDYVFFFNITTVQSLDFLSASQTTAVDEFRTAFFAWLKLLSDGHCIHLVKAICKTDMNPIEIYTSSKKKLSSLSPYLPLLLLLLPQDNQLDLIKKTKDVLRSVIGSDKTIIHESAKNLAEDLLFLIKSSQAPK